MLRTLFSKSFLVFKRIPVDIYLRQCFRSAQVQRQGAQEVRVSGRKKNDGNGGAFQINNVIYECTQHAFFFSSLPLACFPSFATFARIRTAAHFPLKKHIILLRDAFI